MIRKCPASYVCVWGSDPGVAGPEPRGARGLSGHGITGPRLRSRKQQNPQNPAGMEPSTSGTAGGGGRASWFRPTGLRGGGEGVGGDTHTEGGKRTRRGWEEGGGG